ncbi:MAG: hypothetical protein OIN87_06355 [Candidatus Methanoperedens sp.]|nr:hypothetical protein [Candidatus Methanoperedens sp.]
MNQQDTYKILAAFLVITMLGSVFAYIFIGNTDNNDSQSVTQTTNTDKYNPDFWTVNEPFNTISDSLSMTPPGAEVAYYMDLENMPIQMIQLVRQEIQIIQEVDTLYNSNTTKMYYAGIKDGNNNSFLLLSTMSIPKNDFEYVVIPNTNNILQRQDNGMINIMGYPIIYASDQTASEVLNILYGQNETNTSYDSYKDLLTKVEPAPYQILNSNVTFAKQFYIGLNLVNGSYERTTAYLDVNSTILRKLNQSKANSTEKGFEQYSINQTGNYTIVKIVSPELFQILNEETN